VLLTSVLWVFLHCAGAAVFIRWIADGIQERRERSFPALVRAGLVGGTMIFLILVLYGVALFGTGMLMVWMSVSRNPLILPPTLLLTFFIVVYISFASSLALAPAVLEAHGPLDAFRRSATILKGHRLRVLGLYAILGTLAFGAFLLSIFVTGVLGTLGHLEAVGSILVLIVQGLSVGLFLIASTVVYVRLRPAEASPSLSSQEAPATILVPPDQSVSAARIETAEGEALPLFRNH
jgi:MFS family permease